MTFIFLQMKDQCPQSVLIRMLLVSLFMKIGVPFDSKKSNVEVIEWRHLVTFTCVFAHAFHYSNLASLSRANSLSQPNICKEKRHHLLISERRSSCFPIPCTTSTRWLMFLAAFLVGALNTSLIFSIRLLCFNFLFSSLGNFSFGLLSLDLESDPITDSLSLFPINRSDLDGEAASSEPPCCHSKWVVTCKSPRGL